MTTIIQDYIQGQNSGILDVQDGFENLYKSMMNLRKSLKKMKLVMLSTKARLDPNTKNLPGNDITMKIVEPCDESTEGRSIYLLTNHHIMDRQAVDEELKRVENISQYLEKCRTLCKIYQTRLTEQIDKAKLSAHIQAELLSLSDKRKPDEFDAYIGQSLEKINTMSQHVNQSDIIDIEPVGNSMEMMLLLPRRIQEYESNISKTQEYEKMVEKTKQNLNASTNSRFREFNAHTFEEKVGLLQTVANEVDVHLSYLAELCQEIQMDLLIQNING